MESSERERLHAAIRLVLDSGDLSPMGARILGTVVNDMAPCEHPRAGRDRDGAA